jgi:hypothetical protein
MMTNAAKATKVTKPVTVRFMLVSFFDSPLRTSYMCVTAPALLRERNLSSRTMRVVCLFYGKMLIPDT